jgi:hypothetical protein
VVNFAGWVTPRTAQEGKEGNDSYTHEISNILSTIYQPTQAEKLPSFLLSKVFLLFSETTKKLLFFCRNLVQSQRRDGHTGNKLQSINLLFSSIFCTERKIFHAGVEKSSPLYY